MRLLLVEDDRMIGESLQRALRLEGYAVDWVRDAAAAMSVHLLNKPVKPAALRALLTQWRASRVAAE